MAKREKFWREGGEGSWGEANGENNKLILITNQLRLEFNLMQFFSYNLTSLLYEVDVDMFNVEVLQVDVDYLIVGIFFKCLIYIFFNV